MSSSSTPADREKAKTLRGIEIINHYRAQRAAGNKAARFCTESKFDECCAWVVRLEAENETAS